MGRSISSSRVGSRVEILTIIMLTPTWDRTGFGHEQFQLNISYGGLAIVFFLHKCLMGSSSRVLVVVEILTIIMLTLTGKWTGFWG